MRKEYIRPAIDLIQIRAEHLFLTASIQSNNPIDYEEVPHIIPRGSALCLHG